MACPIIFVEFEAIKTTNTLIQGLFLEVLDTVSVGFSVFIFDYLLCQGWGYLGFSSSQNIDSLLLDVVWVEASDQAVLQAART